MAERGKFNVQTQNNPDIVAPDVSLAPVRRKVSPVEVLSETIVPSLKNLVHASAEESQNRALGVYNSLMDVATSELNEAMDTGSYDVRQYSQLRDFVQQQAFKKAQELNFNKNELTDLQQLMTQTLGENGILRRGRVEREVIPGLGAITRVDGQALESIDVDPTEIRLNVAKKIADTYGESARPLLNKLMMGEATPDQQQTIAKMYHDIQALDALNAENMVTKAIITNADDQRTVLKYTADEQVGTVERQIVSSVMTGFRSSLTDKNISDMTPDQLKAIAEQQINQVMFSDSIAQFSQTYGIDRWNARAEVLKQNLRMQIDTLINAQDRLKLMEYDTAVQEQVLNQMVNTIELGVGRQNPQLLFNLRNANSLRDFAEFSRLGALAKMPTDNLPGVLFDIAMNGTKAESDRFQLNTLTAAKTPAEVETKVSDNFSRLTEYVEGAFPSSTNPKETTPIRAHYALQYLYQFLTNPGFEKYIKDNSVERDLRESLLNRIRQYEDSLIAKTDITQAQVRALQKEYKVGPGTYVAYQEAMGEAPSGESDNDNTPR